MTKINYISLKRLKKNLELIIESVLKEDVEYIVMINKEPKVKISSTNKNGGKELVFAESVSDERLKKFVE